MWVGRVLLGLVCAGVLGWMALALYFDLVPGPTWLRGGLALLVPVAALIALVLVRPRRWALAGIGVAFAVVVAAWLAIPPSNSREWQPDVAALPYADIRGDRVIVHNVRNADYRSETDYTVRLEERDLDLSRLRSLDLFLVYWGSPLIAHTILSWGFEGDQYLAISIETRKEKGESYSALRGFFRQYELTFVVADERDVVRLRTNYRGEEVYVYRLDVPPADARKLLLRYLQAINDLRDRPQWYNALTDNCTTAIQRIAAADARRSWWSWKLFLNGHLDELAYDIGAFDQSLPFGTLKSKSRVNDKAMAAGADPQFSVRIREGLPRMSP
jgi:membrane protein implicated in regulation of membrane protease activity